MSTKARIAPKYSRIFLLTRLQMRSQASSWYPVNWIWWATRDDRVPEVLRWCEFARPCLAEAEGNLPPPFGIGLWADFRTACRVLEALRE